MDKDDIVKGSDQITLIEDTRNQIGQHKNVEAYCRRNSIKIVRKALSVGDYMLCDDDGNPYGNVSVDSKASIMELCKNVMSSDHLRFRREMIRAKELGIQLVVLIEELPPFGRLDMWEVPKWQSSGKYHRYGQPMTMVQPSALRRACITMQERYGVKFRFCTRRQSPARIIKYLKGELK